jgi:hypothetical protein
MAVPRRFLLLSPLMPAMATLHPAFAAAAENTPDRTIERLYDELLALMKDAKRLSFEARYNRLAATIARSFDLPLMTRIAIGPGWSQIATDQQKRITDAFSRYTISVYVNRFDDYGGERFEVDGKRCPSRSRRAGWMGQGSAGSVRPFGKAPDEQRLAEIGRLALEAPHRRNIENSDETEAGICCEAAQSDSGALKLALQHIVEEQARLLHVVEHTTDGVAPVFRQERDVDLCDLPDQDAVDELIDVENVAVQRLQGVIVLLEGGALGGIGRRRGAAGNGQSQ